MELKSGDDGRGESCAHAEADACCEHPGLGFVVLEVVEDDAVGEDCYSNGGEG